MNAQVPTTATAAASPAVTQATRGAITAVLFDVTGTLLEHGQPIDGAVAALSALRGAGVPIRVLTNTDTMSPQRVAARLQAAGLPIDAVHVFTPVSALLGMLARTPGMSCHCLVSEEVARCLPDPGAGGDAEAMTPTHVVVGDVGEQLSAQALNAALQVLLGGARLLALQPGRRVSTPQGPRVDTGAVAAALAYAAQVDVEVIGKPSPAFFRLALDDLGGQADGVLMVGDDLEADIGGAQAAGCRSVLVATGCGASVDLATARARGAEAIIDSVADLPGIVGVRTEHDR